LAASLESYRYLSHSLVFLFCIKVRIYKYNFPGACWEMSGADAVSSVAEATNVMLNEYRSLPTFLRSENVVAGIGMSKQLKCTCCMQLHSN